MPAEAAARRRAYWLRMLHQWHWISAALSLAGLLLFAVTGITLNHAAQIEAQPMVTSLEAQLPPALLAQLAAPPAGSSSPARQEPLPPEVRGWLATALQVPLPAQPAEWSAEEVYLPLPRPGGDAWLRIDRASGATEYERTDRGWISYFNDLHKGRHTGTVWAWFIDAFAVACLVFAATGLFILKLHAGQRPLTWPLAGLGLVLPLLLALLFIH